MKFIKKAKEIAGKIAGKISGIFDRGKLNDLAKETGFVQRSTSKIKGEDFVRLLTVETLGEEAVSTEGMCDILLRINPEADMSPQALSERINKEEAAEYLKEVWLSGNSC